MLQLSGLYCTHVTHVLWPHIHHIAVVSDTADTPEIEVPALTFSACVLPKKLNAKQSCKVLAVCLDPPLSLLGLLQYGFWVWDTYSGKQTTLEGPLKALSLVVGYYEALSWRVRLGCHLGNFVFTRSGTHTHNQLSFSLVRLSQKCTLSYDT